MCDRFGSFLAGLVLGGLVGGITALLLAPAPGEETRRRLAEKAEEATEEARKRVEEYGELGAELVAEKRKAIEEAIEEGKKAAEEKARELRESLERRRAGEEGGTTGA